MLVVGLTGGIGCGKTAVSDIFEKDFNIPVIDADAIARNLTDTSEVSKLLYENLGTKYFDDHSNLLRHKLREAVFSDSEIRDTLEAILHPLVFKEIRRRLNHLDDDYCIVVIPLLLETQRTDMIDRALVVDCTIEQQIQRVTQRDKCSELHVRTIISAQIKRNERLKLANDIIENQKSLKCLQKKVAILHTFYTTIAKPSEP